MATHPLGAGTVNVTFNVKLAVRDALGRAAFQINVSRSKFIRRLLSLAAHVINSWPALSHAAALDRMAIAKLHQACSVDSIGGEMVTPCERAEIAAIILKSAEVTMSTATTLNIRQEATA